MIPGNKYEFQEAIQIVLSGQPNLTATANVIIREIERRNLYRKKDGSPLTVDQIHARFNTHRDLIERVAPSTFRLIGPTLNDTR